MTQPIRILYVDDSPHDRELVCDALEIESGGFQVTQAASRADFETHLLADDYDLVLSDFNILGFEGLQVIEAVRKYKPGVPVLIVTGTGSEEIAVEAMKRGACDYVIKSPHHIRRLPQTIRAELDKKKLADEHNRLKQERDRLFDYSIDLMCIANFDGYFNQINPAWGRTFGWTDEELLARPYVEFVHSDDQQATTEAVAQLIRERQPLSFEHRFRSKDGSYKLLAWNAYPLLEDELIFAIARDVTARKQAEEKIERHVGRLAALRQIDQAIASTFDMRLALNILVEQAVAHLHVDIAGILLLNPQSLSLEYGTSYGLPVQTTQPTHLSIADGYAGQVVRERRLIHVSNIPLSNSGLARALRQNDETLVSYYGVPLIAKGEVKGVLEIVRRALLELDPEWLDFLQALAGEAAIAIDNAQLFNGLQRSNIDLALAYDATIEGWSRALDLRDRETEGHSQRVTELTVKLAQAMGIPSEALVHVRRGALLHDIGKMGVPDSILLKPGPLTEAEWAIMRQHPVHAFEMLSPIAYLRPALDIPYCHHEKWDGTGYPRGLEAEEIPLAARIFTVIDVWDALNSDRPYRSRWPSAQVKEYLRSNAGLHFDPKVVELFLSMDIDL